jgi:FkbM family methyltransferase
VQRTVKKALQAVANRLGYRIERIRPRLPGEELNVLDLALVTLNRLRHGRVRFVQIGANDGVQEDPCYAWITRFSWRGALVEPQPQLADALRRLHAGNANIRVVQAVITDSPGRATLHYLRPDAETPAWASGIASLSREAILGHRSKIPGFDRLLSTLEVEALSFGQLLERARLDDLDLLLVDAEGYDHRILATLDFSRLRPAVICYEHVNLTPEDNAACRRVLAAHGYRFASWLGDTVACQPEVLPVSADRRTYLAA